MSVSSHKRQGHTQARSKKLSTPVWGQGRSVFGCFGETVTDLRFLPDLQVIKLACPFRIEKTPHPGVRDTDGLLLRAQAAARAASWVGPHAFIPL